MAMYQQCFILFTVIVLFVDIPSTFANTARNTAEILKIVTRIEDQLSREERIRGLTDMVRIESAVDKINKKLDRIIDTMDEKPSARSGQLQGIGHDAELPSRRDSIDLNHRLTKIETSVENLLMEFNKIDLARLDDMDKRSSQLSSDLNQKLRKMMNIITALYEMNKEMKTNFGGRSEGFHDVQQTPQNPGGNFAAEFLIENLEELERKIKEQFSVLGNDIRTEITGLKIVASSVSDGCDTSMDVFEDSVDNSRVTAKRTSRTKAPKNQEPGAGRSTAETDALDTIMQSLGRSTREIREEIHQGLQTIDSRLSNLTCGENLDLQSSSSNPSSVRVSREYQGVPEQHVDNENYGQKLECTRVSKNQVSPKSCADLRSGGANCDGVYVIFPKNVRAVRVYCDMTTEGGGWTVLMRRGDYGKKMTNFHKNWMSYKNGFGDVEGEFWLGNDVFHLLTEQESNILRVHLEAFDGAATDMTYSSFKISNETESYKLHIGPTVPGSSSASSGLRYHNHHPFSTFDKKNDNFEQNCAATYKGGWWFNGCYFGFLTGEYFKVNEKRENWQGMLWYDWKGNAALKGAYMMIRPKNFTIY